MSDLGRVLRLDARRTALLVAVPVLTVVGTVAAAMSLCPVAYWDNTVVALVNAVRFLGPVAAALAAWTAVRERPLDYLRDLTARSPATGVLFDLLLLSAAALVSYAAVTVVVVAATLAQSEAGHPHPLGVVAGAGSLVLHVVVGYLTGRLIPHRATAALVLTVAAVWAAARVPGVSWWSLLPPAAFDHIALFTTLRPEILVDQLTWAAGLTTALILGYVMWATRRLLIVLPLVVALGATGAATLGLHRSDGTVTPVAAEPVCRDWPLTVCVHPALRDALPRLIAAATPLAARLDGTPGAFTTVEQRPAWAPLTVEDGVATVHLDETLAPGYAARAVRQISETLKDARTCTDPPNRYRELVDAWLLGDDPPSVPDAQTGRRFASWSEARRRSWLRVHFAAYRDCTLGPVNFRPFEHPRLYDAGADTGRFAQ
ncbi:hypothetical protein BZB76_2154 [Actinomadura pelletieri DSM 43383]|uniref:Uncharacterized protein n=1 Tax=Actinomadura pelletieri DSM 43383 TaxID=1120940 RepID=A0A495QTE1_9ACTN|nr:hypothetical protein [Actinomadura pelletieri]RKS76792.1 hypothetical protein BZB76_2154 [Actinomadura pelletieri DSM 43383]